MDIIQNPNPASGADESQNPADQINRLHVAILEADRKTVSNAIEIGKLLTEQKARLKHGEWLRWFDTNIQFDRSTGENYRTLYRQREKIGNLPNLTEAYRVLGLLPERRTPKPPKPNQLNPKPDQPQNLGSIGQDSSEPSQPSPKPNHPMIPGVDYVDPAVDEWWKRYLAVITGAETELDHEKFIDLVEDIQVHADDIWAKELDND